MKTLKQSLNESLTCDLCNGSGEVNTLHQTILGSMSIKRKCICTGEEPAIISSDLKQSTISKSESADDYKNCLMVMFDMAEWESILDTINDDDLTADGKETEQHVTVLYGLHKTVQFDELKPIFRPTKAVITDVSIFENEEFDVLKFDISSNHLEIMNHKAKELPHYNKYPVYHAHMTIAYIKKGEAKKYIPALKQFIGTDFNTMQFKYTVNIDGNKTYNYHTLQEQ